MYTPDNWVILKIKIKNDTHYRVLAGWSGSYIYGSNWRMNSGITRVESEGDFLLIYGGSGSCYRCHKDTYGLRMNNAGIYNQLKEKYAVEMLDENTDWEGLKYEK